MHLCSHTRSLHGDMTSDSHANLHRRHQTVTPTLTTSRQRPSMLAARAASTTRSKSIASSRFARGQAAEAWAASSLVGLPTARRSPAECPLAEHPHARPLRWATTRRSRYSAAWRWEYVRCAEAARRRASRLSRGGLRVGGATLGQVVPRRARRVARRARRAVRRARPHEPAGVGLVGWQG